MEKRHVFLLATIIAASGTTMVSGRSGSATSAVTFLDASGCYVPADGDTVDFGSVPTGDSATLGFAVRNIHPLGSISSTDIETWSKVFSPSVTLFTLQAGADLSLECTYRPVTRGKSTLDSVTFTGAFPPKKVYLLGVAANGVPVLTTTGVPSAAEGREYSYTLTATDPDNDAVTFSKASGPPWMTISSQGVLSGTPGYEENGSTSSFRVLVSDPYAGADTFELSILVENTDRPPDIVIEDTVKGIEGTELRIEPLVIDPDGGSHTVAIEYEGYPDWLVLTGNDLVGTYTDNAALDSVTIKATTGGLTSTKTVYISISDSSETPVLTSSPTAVAVEDSLFVYVVTARDPDGQDVEVDIAGFPDWLSRAGDTLRGTPGEGRLDTSFIVSLSDGALRGVDTVAITVTPVNDDPVIHSRTPMADTVRLVFDSLIAFQVDYSDTDNVRDSLLVWWTYDGERMEMPYRVRREGTHLVMFHVTDGIGDTVTTRWVCEVDHAVLTAESVTEFPIPADGVVSFLTSDSVTVEVRFAEVSYEGEFLFAKMLPGDPVLTALAAMAPMDLTTTVAGGFSATLTARHPGLDESHTFILNEDATAGWVPVETTFDPPGGLAVSTTHFSSWAIVERSAVASETPAAHASVVSRSLTATVTNTGGSNGPVLRCHIPVGATGQRQVLKVVDVGGRVVFRWAGESARPGWRVVPLVGSDDATYPSGIYVYHLLVGEDSVHGRFRKVR
jgi:hypothetical protein